MDFVWPYFAAQAHGPELELSVASVARFFSGEHRLIVLGDEPGVMSPSVIHIPLDRITGVSAKHRAFRDTYSKATYASRSDEIADDFVWMADDIFFVGAVTGDMLRDGFHDESGRGRMKLANWNPGNDWLKLKKKTLLELSIRGFDIPRDYDTHAPMVVSGSKLHALGKEYGMPAKVYLWQSIYGNKHLPNSVVVHESAFMRVSRVDHVKLAAEKLKSRSIINFANSAWNVDAENIVRLAVGFEPVDQVAPSLSYEERLSQRHPCLGDHRTTTGQTVNSSLCGRRGESLPLYRCEKFNEMVTIDPYRSGGTAKVCKSCGEFDWTGRTRTQPTNLKYPLKGFTAVIAWTPRTGRQEGYDYVRSWAIERFEEVIVESSPADKRFNKSRLLNRAVNEAKDGNVICLLDADCVCPDSSLLLAADQIKRFPTRVYKPFNEMVFLKRDQSLRIYDKGGLKSFFGAGSASTAPAGITLITKAKYLEIGGHDESYEEWGWEDAAFIRSCRQAGLSPEWGEGTLVHFYHPKNPNHNRSNRDRYYGIDPAPPTLPMLEDTSDVVAMWKMVRGETQNTAITLMLDAHGLTYADIASVGQLKRNMRACFVWNGESPRDKQIMARCKTLGIPFVVVEQGYLPQDTTMMVTERGSVGGTLFLGDRIPDITPEEDAELDAIALEFLDGRQRDVTSESPVMGILQLPDDTSIRHYSPFSTMPSFAAHVTRMYPDESVVFRAHPRDRTVKMNGFDVSRTGELIDDILIAKEVVGINSTSLFESVLLGIPATAIGLSPLQNRSWKQKRKIVHMILQSQCDRDPAKLAESMKKTLGENILKALNLTGTEKIPAYDGPLAKSIRR